MTVLFCSQDNFPLRNNKNFSSENHLYKTRYAIEYSSSQLEVRSNTPKFYNIPSDDKSLPSTNELVMKMDSETKLPKKYDAKLQEAPGPIVSIVSFRQDAFLSGRNCSLLKVSDINR